MNGSILRFWRKLNGHSLKYIVDRVPVEYTGFSDTSSLSRLESNKTKLSEDNLVGFFKAYGLHYRPLCAIDAHTFDDLIVRYIQALFYKEDTSYIITDIKALKDSIQFDFRYFSYVLVLTHDSAMSGEQNDGKCVGKILNLLLEFVRDFNNLQQQLLYDALAIYYEDADLLLEAKKYIEKSIAFNGNIYLNGLVFYHQSVIFRKCALLPEALKAAMDAKQIFDREMSFERSLRSLLEMATIESELRQFELANHHFNLVKRSILTLNLKHYEDVLMNNWIWVDMRTQSYDRMLEKANYMISRYPDIPDYYFYRGWGLAHINSEERSAALSSVTKAVELLSQKDHLSRLEENFKAYVHLYKMILESRASVKTIYSMFEKMLLEFKDMPSYVKAFMLEMYYEYCMTMNDQAKGNKILEELVMIR